MRRYKGWSVAWVWILVATMLFLGTSAGLGPFTDALAEEMEVASKSDAHREADQESVESGGGLEGQSSAEDSGTVIRRPSHPVGRETVEVIQYGEGEDRFQVSLPANTEGVFDFIMDPQELIGKTDAAAYGDLVFEEGATLFFKHNGEEAQVDHSSTSDTLTIANMGTVDAEVSITAEILSDTLGGIVLTDDAGFTDDTEPSLYLALTDGTDVSPILADKKAYIDMTLEGYREKGDSSSCKFHFVGAVNKNGDWSQIEDVVPKLVVTWSVRPSDTAWLEGIYQTERYGQTESDGQTEGSDQMGNSGQTEDGGQSGSNGLAESNSPTESGGQTEGSDQIGNSGQTEDGGQSGSNGLAESNSPTGSGGQTEGGGQTGDSGQIESSDQSGSNDQAESESYTGSGGQMGNNGQTENGGQAGNDSQTENGGQAGNDSQIENSGQTGDSGQAGDGSHTGNGGQAEGDSHTGNGGHIGNGGHTGNGSLTESGNPTNKTGGVKDTGGVSAGAGADKKVLDGTEISGLGDRQGAGEMGSPKV